MKVGRSEYGGLQSTNYEYVSTLFCKSLCGQGISGRKGHFSLKSRKVREVAIIKEKSAFLYYRSGKIFHF